MQNPMSLRGLVEAMELADATFARDGGEKVEASPRRMYRHSLFTSEDLLNCFGAYKRLKAYNKIGLKYGNFPPTRLKCIASAVIVGNAEAYDNAGEGDGVLVGGCEDEPRGEAWDSVAESDSDLERWGKIQQCLDPHKVDNREDHRTAETQVSLPAQRAACRASKEQGPEEVQRIHEDFQQAGYAARDAIINAFFT
ncbi:hypothetical protein E1301_Tti013629 [Triplophysa tibetana]|uniref:Uncharacterized protein n=1 Tax=Triplophysa tibetana TaxID=1572043 RepID=A0A5A9NXM8_9TELE|nr:hypothetical protein E1301_Tti013629 [Triplophysa tibetana]